MNIINNEFRIKSEGKGIYGKKIVDNIIKLCLSDTSNNPIKI